MDEQIKSRKKYNIQIYRVCSNFVMGANAYREMVLFHVAAKGWISVQINSILCKTKN